jgi:putative hemolysin
MDNYYIVLTTILFSAFFSGMEIAFISSSKIKIEIDNKKGEFSAKILSFFTSKPAWFIASMLIGNNVAMVVYTLYITDLIEPYLIMLNFNSTLVLLFQTLFSTFFILLFAEFLPKSIFRLNPNSTLRFFSLILFLFYIFLWPLTAFVVFLSNKILKIFGNQEAENKVSFKKTDLDLYISELKKDLDDDEAGSTMNQPSAIFDKIKSQNKVSHQEKNIAENSVVENTIQGHDKLRSMLKRSNS